MFGFACVLLATIGLSAKAILIKLIYIEAPDIDAISILALRFIVAFPFFMLLLAFDRKRKSPPPFTKRHFGSFILLGMVGFYLSAILDFSALAYITASLERLILFLYPTFVVLISFFIRPEEINRHVIAALVTSYIGVAIVFSDQSLVMTDDITKGVLLVFGAAIVFATYTVASVKQIKYHGSIQFTGYAMIAATTMTLIHAVSIHGTSFFNQSFYVYGLILLMALFSTVMPLILIAEGVKRMGASSASIISTLGPVMTISLAYLLLDETIGFAQAFGGLMIILGVFFVARVKNKE